MVYEKDLNDSIRNTQKGGNKITRPYIVIH